eukprot:scaffold33587_cov107-Skeletonema_dohrnii-CCMP3373.AAC.3
MADTVLPKPKHDATLPAGSDDPSLTRAQSSLSVSGVLQLLEANRPELLSLEEEARQQCIVDFIKSLDLDGDNLISSKELFQALCGFYDDAIRANEEALRASSMIRKYRRTIGGLIALTVALVATVFGTSFAAARLAKDTQVTNRALLTKDQEPIGINLNEVDVPLAALAFVPSSVTSKIHELVLTDDDGNTYHRTKQAIDIAPGKSVNLRTTEGDTISWDAAEESKSIVTIELSSGKVWDKSSLCTACTATSLVADDQVDAALNTFYASIQVNDGNRILGRGKVVIPFIGDNCK